MSVSLLETSSFKSVIYWDPPENNDELFNVPPLSLEKRYSIPKNSEAQRIWYECNFLETEFESTISHRLNEWATNLNLLWFNSDKNEIHITWISPSNVQYNTSWRIFIRWFLCACSELKF